MISSRLLRRMLVASAIGNLSIAAVVAILASFWLADSRVDVDRVRHLLWMTAGVEGLAVTGFSCCLLSRGLKRLAAIRGAVEKLADGDYGHRIYVSNRDELGNLAETLNRLSMGMRDRISQLSQVIARQSAALEGMVEGVIAVDARQRIVLANEAACQLFDCAVSTVEGRPLLEVIRHHALHQVVTTVLTGGEPQRFEIRRVGFAVMFLDIHVQPLPGVPCPGVVLVIHDKTTLHRLESIRREFVANVSHELKTPLSSIKAYAETLRNGAIDDPQASDRFLERIEEQSDRLNRLIMDMLMLARVESDHHGFEIESLDLPSVVSACVDDHRAPAHAKRVAILVELPEGSPVSGGWRVRADREAFREILDNLLDNAIKYTPENGKVSVFWRSTGSTIQISVCDTGIGLKPDDQERVFERFFRVDKARSRELGGTGLGLSIVKHLAQSMNGTVTVQSEVGNGSTFTVELPAD